MSFLDIIFDPWLGKVLYLPSFWAILIISAFITFLITIAYKYTTDQKEMKRLKEDLKKYQTEMRETKDTKKLMAIQKKAMDLNFKYMGASMKSTLYTFIPIIIIFAWLNTHIAYNPLLPGQEFKITAEFGDGAKGAIGLSSIPDITIVEDPVQTIRDNKAQWTVKGDAGEYKLKFDYNTESYTQSILITEERKYIQPEQIIKDSKIKRIIVGNDPVHPFGKDFNLFGWYPGWLAAYIVLSIGLSTLFRKLMDVY